MTEFKTSSSAIARRRALVMAFRVLAGAAAGLAAAQGHWTAALAMAAMLLILRPGRWLTRYASRVLLLQPNALEERTSGFTRFMLYEEIVQLRMFQKHGEKVKALEVRGPQGGFWIRDYEGMEEIFAELVRRKPPRVIVEVEEAGLF